MRIAILQALQRVNNGHSSNTDLKRETQQWLYVFDHDNATKLLRQMFRLLPGNVFAAYTVAHLISSPKVTCISSATHCTTSSTIAYHHLQGNKADRLGSNFTVAIEEKEEEEEEEADEGASNAAATQINLGVNIMEAATTHDEPIQCRRHQQLSATSREN